MRSTDAPKRAQPDGSAVPAAGLRERKKLKTREAIQRVAMRLFEKRGYEETTIEEIAAAVEISPSTFFNYFPTKEDVVLLDIYDPLALSLIKQRPPDEPLSAVVRHVLDGLGGALERDRELILARSRLVLEVPALRGRLWDELERNQAMFTALLAQRTGRKPTDFELRVIVRVAIAAIWEASVEWVQGGGREDFVALAKRALDLVEAGAQLNRVSNRKRVRRK